jgi:nitrite reductase (NO-forming)
MRKQFGAILLSAGLALTTACSGGAAAAGNAPRAAATPASSSSTGARQVTVDVGNSMSFAPSAIDVRAGQPVELTLRNEGLIPHDFSISEGLSQPVKIEAGGGSNASTTFTIDRPGTYTFICSVPGHEAAGMRGTITAR